MRVFDPVSSRRSTFLNLFIATLFFIIAYQLIQLTVIRRPALELVAERQHQIRVEIPPMRGTITDRHGKEFAMNLKMPSVYAVPRLLSDIQKKELSSKIAPILGISEESVREKLSRDKSFIWLKRKVSFEQARQVMALHASALGIMEESKRFYPQGDLLSHVLGFVNVDNQGLEGIELYKNHELSGRNGFRFTKRDALGREIKALEIKKMPAVNGNSVQLTIDQYVQYITERALDRAVTQWKANWGTAIIMDPHTGEVLAMATRPTYDLNTHGNVKPDIRRNRAVTDMYEPGSVFKIVVSSAALNEKKTTPQSIFYCENGRYNYGAKVLRDVHAYGNLTFEEVLIKSSNIGVSKIANLIGPQILYDYVKKYGFGEPSGFDMPGEASGFIRKPQAWSKTSIYNIPMGHEVLVNALQMTRAMAVVANGGVLVKPYIISKVIDQAGVIIKENKPQVIHRVIEEEVAEKMRHILARVVEEGTGKKAHINGIPVAGKTGTAQKVLPNGRGYSHSNFVASFVGFAPAYNPRLVMSVVIDDPRPMYYGGVVAAPVFQEVMELALMATGYVPSNAEHYDPTGKTLQNVPGNPRTLPRSVDQGKAPGLLPARPGTSR